MSYDLMVFDDVKVPRMKEEFVEWYENQVAWTEDHDYTDISVVLPALQKFYAALKAEYTFADDVGEDGNYQGVEGGSISITRPSVGTSLISASVGMV